LEPAAGKCGYRTIRADKISTPGIITNQVITQILEAEMVVADLTEHNANVYYELAIRHAIRKPLVEIIKKGQTIPFDVAATRVVQMDDPDLNNVQTLQEQVKNHIEAAEKKPSGADNPIAVAIDILALEKSGSPVEAQLGVILEMLADIRARLAALQPNTQPSIQDLFTGSPTSSRGGMSVAGPSAEELRAHLKALEEVLKTKPYSTP
jgi:hypothetical protein